MKLWKVPFHAIYYATWLVGQVIKESVVMMIDTFGTGRRIAPVVIYYPLRVHKERDIAALTASITMTPGTLAMGVTGPKEVDFDAERGERSKKDAFAVKSSEYKVQGKDSTQRFLAIHVMYGQDPQGLMEGFAEMEAKLAPSVAHIKQDFDVEHLVERGRPGPRGYRGSHGGRASDETVFDVEKVDSTPHAAAYVSAIMQEPDDEPADSFQDATSPHPKLPAEHGPANVGKTGDKNNTFRDPLYPNKYQRKRGRKSAKKKKG